MTLEEIRIRNMRGALCDYLDDGQLDEFMCDLRQVLEEERDVFLEKSNVYATAIKTLFEKTND
jgi:hypothetical protein